MTDEPKRLLLTEGGRLGASLTVAKRQVPTDAQLAGLAERLAQAGVVLPSDSLRPPPPPAPAPAPPSAESSSGLVKAALVTIPIVTVGLVALMLQPPSPATDAIDLRPLAPTAGPSAAAKAHATNASPTAALRERAATPSVRTPAEAEATESAPASADANPRANPPAAAEPDVRATPRATAGKAPQPARAADEPRTGLAEVRATGSTNPQATSASSAVEQPGVVVRPSEIELLKRARNLLPADPARALAATEECAREYPRGAYAQERDFIAISALFRVGRRHEGLARAEQFRSAYPKSVYLPQIERMLAVP